MLKIGILLGDDIGPKVVPEAVKVMKAALCRGFVSAAPQKLNLRAAA